MQDKASNGNTSETHDGEAGDCGAWRWRGVPQRTLNVLKKDDYLRGFSYDDFRGWDMLCAEDGSDVLHIFFYTGTVIAQGTGLRDLGFKVGEERVHLIKEHHKSEFARKAGEAWVESIDFAPPCPDALGQPYVPGRNVPVTPFSLVSQKKAVSGHYARKS